MFIRRIVITISLCTILGGFRYQADSATPRTDLRPSGSAYADSVIRYEPAYGGGCTPTNPHFTDPRSAIGSPDYSGGADGTGSVSLGSGGLLELYVWTQIANTGDSRPDLQVYEIGGYTEKCYVALRPVLPTTPEQLVALGLQETNHDGYFEVGRTPSSGEIDIDALFNQMVPGQTLRFDAIQLIDDIHDTPTCNTMTPGADIDAVAALLPWVSVSERSWGSVKSLYRE
jgi:hypothetical protein